jgi:hypothetical protein
MTPLLSLLPAHSSISLYARFPRYEKREHEYATAVGELRETLELEKEAVRIDCEKQLQRKTQQVVKFQAELNSLLQEVSKLKR